MPRSFPFFKQLDLMDCGPTCLKIITTYFGKTFNIEALRARCLLTRDGVSLSGISDAAEALGLQTLAVTASYAMLQNEMPLPCIAHWRQRHFVVVYKVTATKVFVSDPAFGLITYAKAEFIKGWIPLGTAANTDPEGIVLVLEPTPEFFKEPDDVEQKPSLRFLFPYLSPHRRLIVQLFIGLGVGSVIQLILPFLTQAIVDIGISQGNIRFINLVLIGMLTLFVAETVTEVIRSWLLLHITSRVNLNLLSSFLVKLMRLPIAFFETKNIGDLMQRIQDNTRVQTFLSTASFNILFSAFNVLIFSGVIFYYNARLFLVIVVSITAYLAWVSAFMKKRAVLDYKRFDQASGNQSSTIQLLNGMQEIKLNNSTKRRRWEWEAIQVRLFKLSIKSLSLSQLQATGGNFILQLMGIFITYLAANQVVVGGFSLGAMLSIQFMVGQLNAPVQSFIGFMQSYQDAKISLDRMSEIHSKPNETIAAEETMDSLPIHRSIEFKNVFFRYGSVSSAWVLEDLNFIIPQGKVTAIVGASGSGKTTLLKLLLKFYDCQQGEIRVGGILIQNMDTEFWRKNLSVVMQDGYLFADTIARNITESDSDGVTNKEKLLHAAQIAHIEEFIESLPTGYKTRVGSSGINISGGQRQRIFIARAVYKNPEYIFFDEATSALDANNEKTIMQNLQQFYKNKTVVIVAHRLSTVMDADNILVLDKGKLTEQGNHQTLVEKRGTYYELIKNQLELGS